MYSAMPHEAPTETNLNIGMLIGLATSGRLVPPELLIALCSQPMPTNMNVAYCAIKGKPVEEARELCAENSLKLKAPYLWFVDDDTIPPPNTPRRLISVLQNHPEVMVCGGIYSIKADPPSPVVFRGNGLGSFWRWKYGEVFEVTGIGCGCMMINTEIFKILKPPYFPWDKTPIETTTISVPEISEDLSFCSKVREAGYKVVAHGGILCDHFDIRTGKMFSIPDNSYPFRKETTSAEDTQQDYSI